MIDSSELIQNCSCENCLQLSVYIRMCLTNMYRGVQSHKFCRLLKYLVKQGTRTDGVQVYDPP